jgi:hypothetical protein
MPTRQVTGRGQGTDIVKSEQGFPLHEINRGLLYVPYFWAGNCAGLADPYVSAVENTLTEALFMANDVGRRRPSFKRP